MIKIVRIFLSIIDRHHFMQSTGYLKEKEREK